VAILESSQMALNDVGNLLLNRQRFYIASYIVVIYIKRQISIE